MASGSRSALWLTRCRGGVHTRGTWPIGSRIRDSPNLSGLPLALSTQWAIANRLLSGAAAFVVAGFGAMLLVASKGFQGYALRARRTPRRFRRRITSLTTTLSNHEGGRLLVRSVRIVRTSAVCRQIGLRMGVLRRCNVQRDVDTTLLCKVPIKDRRSLRREPTRSTIGSLAHTGTTPRVPVPEASEADLSTGAAVRETRQRELH